MNQPSNERTPYFGAITLFQRDAKRSFGASEASAAVLPAAESVAQPLAFAASAHATYWL